MKKILLGLTAFVAMNAMAEKTAENAVVPGDSLTNVRLQEVQVVSTRATHTTPMAFTNVGKNQIKAVNYGQDIPYLLSLTPSITMTSDAGNGIGYTSLRVRGTDPSRINITANGMPLNDAESATVFWVNMGDFASSVQSMQIQRGVGSSTNGAGAFGATLNMQTENIGQSPYFGVDLSAGSYYSHKETVRFGTGIKNNWGFQGRLSNIGSKGYLDRASTKLNSYFLQAGYFGDKTMLKFITWNGIEETYHAWDYTSKYEQSVYGRRFNSCGAMTWNNDVFYSNQTDNYHQQNYQALLNQYLTRELTLNAGLHYTRGEGYYEQYKIDAKWADYGLWATIDGDVQTDATGVVYKPIVKGDLVRQKKMENDFYGAVASLMYNNHDNLEAVLGSGWNKYDGDHFGRVIWQSANPYKYYYNKELDTKWKDAAGNKYFYQFTDDKVSTTDFEYYRNNAQKTDFNVYGKANFTFWKGISDWAFWQSLNGYVDLQYRHVNYRMQDPTDSWGGNATGTYVIDDNYDFFNPKFGLNYEFNLRHKIYASYAIAHKEPVRNNYEDNQGLPLRAERLNDLEIGYKFQSYNFSAGINAYWMDYKDQFVLTGALNEIGEAVAINVPESYRLGVELEAAWQPVKWFRWDANATFSKNRVKDSKVTLDDGTNVSVGDAPLSFSPDVIFNNLFSFNYKGMKASLQSQYIGKQYMTNSGFDTMIGWDENGNETSESIALDGHFSTNLDLSYTFKVKPLGFKEVTAGITMYNIFSAEFDNNGWAAPAYKKDANGNVVAYNGSYASDGALRDQWAAGFAPSAPFNFMAHLSVNF